MKKHQDHKKDQINGASDPSRKDHPNVEKGAHQPSDQQASDDTLEFVVTEKNEDDREFVGGRKEFSADTDGLSIESPSELMEKEALSNKKKAAGAGRNRATDIKPIGQTEPPQPLETAENQAFKENQTSRVQQVRKLSAAEVKEIEKNLYGGSPYLTDQEKEKLINKIEKLDASSGKTTPVSPARRDPAGPHPEAKSNFPSPAISKRVRGIAYFYKNYIKVLGNQDLHAGDELFIEGRSYELTPKRFNMKAIIVAGTTLFALLMFLIVVQFVPSAGTGRGEIIGMVLNEAGQPYVQGASIRFPELGKSTISTPQGFFISGLIPEGSHKIEYSVDGSLLKVDYATVVSDKITMITLKPAEMEIAVVPSQIPREPEPQTSVRSSEPATPEGSKPTPARSSKKVIKKSRTSSDKQNPAKVTLAANVEGAQFALDGSVLGAGNLTYSKIPPGKHEYSVIKDGFQPATGTIKLISGENKTLNVDLEPMSQSAKAQVYSEDNYYYSGVAALKDGNLETAIADFTEAINKRPSYAEAYFARAEAYSIRRDKQLAHDDYIRAAEIFQIKKNYNQAITAYNNAVDVDKKSVTAYLGRANTYLIKGEEIASIADYETVLKFDKRNEQAYFGLGEARFKQGRYKKATKHFKDARSIDQQNPLIYQYLMLCYLATDDIKRVKKSFEKYSEMATDEQMTRLRTDSRFRAVLRIVEKD